MIVFEQGIIVITHWKINNFIRKDRYKPTLYENEVQSLSQTKNGMYIKEVGCHLVAERLTSGQPSIDKGRLDKVSIEKGRVEQATPFSFYGEYKNIRLTEEEYRKLKDKLQGHTDMMIEKLSRYIKSICRSAKISPLKPAPFENRILSLAAPSFLELSAALFKFKSAFFKFG